MNDPVTVIIDPRSIAAMAREFRRLMERFNVRIAPEDARELSRRAEPEHNARGNWSCTECGHQGNGQVPGCPCRGCDDTPPAPKPLPDPAGVFAWLTESVDQWVQGNRENNEARGVRGIHPGGTNDPNMFHADDVKRMIQDAAGHFAPWPESPASLANRVMADAPESWYGGASGEDIAVAYVRELERRVKAFGGSLEREPSDPSELGAPVGPAPLKLASGEVAMFDGHRLRWIPEHDVQDAPAAWRVLNVGERTQ